VLGQESAKPAAAAKNAGLFAWLFSGGGKKKDAVPKKRPPKAAQASTPAVELAPRRSMSDCVGDPLEATAEMSTADYDALLQAVEVDAAAMEVRSPSTPRALPRATPVRKRKVSTHPAPTVHACAPPPPQPMPSLAALCPPLPPLRGPPQT